jgi:hypothetical protein
MTYRAAGAAYADAVPPLDRYHLLAQYLAAQPPKVTRVSLTLAEVERIVGDRLARSAFTRNFWTASASAVTPTLRRAGWQVAAVDVRANPPAVTFGRAGTVQKPSPSQPVPLTRHQR